MFTAQTETTPVADGRTRAVDATSLAFLHVDRAGIIRDWNPAAARLFGWTREEAVGRPLADTIVPPQLRSGHHAGFARRLVAGDDGTPLGDHVQVPAIHRDGTALQVSMNVDRLGEDGFFAFVTDQTDWHRAQQELQRSNTLISAILQHATAMISAKGLDGDYLFVNGEYERVFQVTAADMVGRREHDVVPAAVAAARRATDVAVAESGTARTDLEEIPFGDDIRQYVVTRVPLTDPDGSVYGVCTIAIDDTARQRSEAALKDSERRFWTTVNNAPGMLYQFRVDTAGNSQFTFVSDACRDIFGVEPAELVGTANLQVVDGDQRESFIASIRESAETLEPWHWRGSVVRRDGERRWVHGVSRPRREPDGGTVWDGMLLDRTREREAEERLAGTRRDLDDLTRRLAPLSFTAEAGVPHPLTGLKERILPVEHDLLEDLWAAANRGESADAELAGPDGPVWVRFRPRTEGDQVLVDGACFDLGGRP
ncbi:PAS domain S-box protein [Actinoplanes sp. NPDC051851]|uniref:PAS domain S-box protein n=1 Tax=Actinoplanes sp. NPDC051851 TaxID=3154753 RepID=UPI003420AB14